MTVVVASRTQKEVRKDIQAMQKASKEILKSKASARAYLVENGFITKSGKLTKRYGG